MAQTRTIQQVYEDFLELSADEREKLLLLLREFDSCGDSQAEIAREWNEEAARRYQEYKDGNSKAVPLGDALERIRAQLGK